MPVAALTVQVRAFPAFGVIYAAAAALAVAAFALAPGETERAVAFACVTAVSAAALLVRGSLHRGAVGQAWLALGAGMALWAVGDFGYALVADGTFPSIADVLYVSAYVFLFGGVVRLMQAAGHREATALIDAAIVGLAVALLVWLFVIIPASVRGDVLDPASLLALGYPVADILLVAVLAPLSIARGTRTVAGLLLPVGIGFVAATDVIYSAQLMAGTYAGGAIDLGWLAGYTLIGAAAAHSSSGREWRGYVPLSPVRDLARTIGLSSAVLVPPLVLLTNATEARSGRIFESLVSLLLALLVVGRLHRTMSLLVSAEARFRQFMNQPALIAFMKDGDGRYRYINERAQEVCDLRGRDWFGRRAAELFSEEDATRRSEQDTKVRRELRPATWSEERGGRTWHAAKFPITGAPGWVGILGIDMTEQRLRERDAERREGERRLIVESLAGLTARSTPDETAEAVCGALVTVPDVSLAAILARDGKGIVKPLAIMDGNGRVLERLAVDPDRSQHLLSNAAKGPWIEPWRDVRGHPYRATLARLGIVAHAYAPLVADGETIGILLIGSSRPDAETWLGDWQPALLELAGIASALLARSHAERSLREAEVARIRRIVATGAFAIVFQPIVRLQDGEVVGYEALTRFEDGSAPDTVFRAAEAIGMGPELEVATVARALEGARQLPAAAWLNLNLSPPMLCAEPVARLLRTADREIVVEVTEHAEVADYRALRSAFERLGEGARLCVDDAGAGFASLRHIVELAPAFVKIDRSLVAGIDGDPARRAAVAGMVHFAAASGARLVAEGIERQPEADVLRDLGVELGQGYLLGRPGPVPAH